MDKDQAAELLSNLFEVEHTADDILGIRTDDEGTTFVVSAFGNKVAFCDDGEATVLVGPHPGNVVVQPPVEVAATEEPSELPPLPDDDGAVYSDSVEDDEDGEEQDEALENLTVAQLRAMAEERGLDVPSKATKPEVIAALTEE